MRYINSLFTLTLTELAKWTFCCAAPTELLMHSPLLYLTRRHPLLTFFRLDWKRFYFVTFIISITSCGQCLWFIWTMWRIINIIIEIWLKVLKSSARITYYYAFFLMCGHLLGWVLIYILKLSIMQYTGPYRSMLEFSSWCALFSALLCFDFSLF